MLNRLENDVNKVVDFLTETLPNTLGVLAMFLGAFFYLFSMDKMLCVELFDEECHFLQCFYHKDVLQCFLY